VFPDARKAALDELGERSWHVLTAYVRGVVFVAFVDAVGIGLALFLIGVPLVLPLALITFILAFVPLLGAIVAGAAAALVALVAVGPTAALLVIGAVILVQQVEGNILYPMIVGRTVSLHPVAVFLAVTIGGLLYGIVGAALAVPLATVAAATIKVVDRHSVHGEVAVGPPPVQEEQSAGAT
jgi:predicted PurR-regulated permease PerM